MPLIFGTHAVHSVVLRAENDVENASGTTNPISILIAIVRTTSPTAMLVVTHHLCSLPIPKPQAQLIGPHLRQYLSSSAPDQGMLLWYCYSMGCHKPMGQHVEQADLSWLQAWPGFASA